MKTDEETIEGIRKVMLEGRNYGFFEGYNKALQEVFPKFDELLEELNGIFAEFIVSRKHLQIPLKQWREKYEKLKPKEADKDGS